MATALEISSEGTDYLEISQSDGTVSHKAATKLEDILEVEKTKCNVELTKEILAVHGTKKLCRIIPVASILSAVCQDKPNTTSQLTVQYIHRTGKSILKTSSVCLKGDSSVCNAWETKLQEYIKLVPHRPRRLLIIVNPESGKREGLKIYKSKVEPIFKLARIETEVVVTERAGHAEEMMASRDLSGIDGLVLVGGDGIFHEVANGALRKIQKDSGIDFDNPYSIMKPMMIPVGMIPAGTGNGIAKEFFGCKDPVVAALAIVLGQSKPQSTFSVHANGKLLRYSIILLGYGFGADLAYEAEERRHLGTARYAYALTKFLVGNKQRCMDMEIEYLPEENPHVNNSESKDRHKEDWKKLEGRFSGISTFCVWNNLNISDPRILHSRDKGVIIAVTKHTSRIQLINFLYRVVKAQVIELIDPDFSYMKLLAVHSFKVRLKSPSDPETKEGLLEGLLNVDGEIHRLGASEFEARCRPGLVQLYHCVPSDDKKGVS